MGTEKGGGAEFFSIAGDGLSGLGKKLPTIRACQPPFGC
jgi:hypothetical protein